MTLGTVGMIITMALIVLNGEGSAFSDNWFYIFIFALSLISVVIHEQVLRVKIRYLEDRVDKLTASEPQMKEGDSNE